MVSAEHAGDILLNNSIVLHDVLYLPMFDFNLLSISKLTKALNYFVSFSGESCLIQDSSKRMIGSGKIHNGLYLLQQEGNLPANNSFTFCNSVSVPANALWHFRLGHASHSKLVSLCKQLPYISCNKHAICDVCHFAKQRRIHFPISQHRAVNKFDLLHMDLWGPFSTTSIHNQKYFLTIVDDFSQFTWVVMLKGKFEAQCQIQKFIQLVETQFEARVKVIRSDNGPEFALPSFYASKGIVHQCSCVETPQQNGQVERKHQDILNIARALLFQSCLPKFFWSYAVLHATYLMNRVPSAVLKDRTPYEVLHGSLPNLSQLRVFGCLCFASTLQAHRSKFDSRSRKGVFLGYRPGMKGYAIYDLHAHKVFVSRHVSFHELVFPYKDGIKSPNHWQYLEPAAPSFNHNSPSITLPSITPPIPTSNSNPLTQVTSPNQSATTTNPDIDPTNQLDPADPPQPAATFDSLKPTRKSTRPKHTPAYLHDYQCHVTTKYPISNYLSYQNLSPSHRSFALSLTTMTEPSCYTEAKKHQCWREAMKLELDALAANKTWCIVDLPPGIVPIGNKWVYKIKRKSDGSIERFKARLVAKGYTQTEGLDYFDTFSPVAKLTTVRLILARASIHHWHVHQLDVNNAFLHGELQEDVYMVIPQGVPSSPNKVCKLLKSLYGLKQASRKWYKRLTALLLNCGYHQANSDHSLFTKHTHDTFTTLLVYVDDIVLVGTSLTEFDAVKTTLHSAFGIKDLGILKFFLGLEAAHSTKGITLCQRQYCLDLLEDCGTLGSKPLSTPVEPGTHLHNADGPLYSDVSSYRRLIGRLLYLTTTRPDISFAIQQLSQFLDKPTETHYKAAQRVLKYLKGCPGKGIFFPRSSSLQILGFSDADWAGCPDTRRSVSGFCFFLGDSLICWKSKKQTTVARSSSKAEYRALGTATCELQWLSFLLQDLRVHCSKQAVLFCDNQSALHIAANPVFHEHTKHLEIDCHVVRERCISELMKLLPLASEDQLADLFTKALSPKIFSHLLSKLSLIDIYQPSTCGGITA